MKTVKPAKVKLNWNEIELEFVLGTMTMRQLAQKHGVSNNTLGSRAVRGEWEQKRTQKRMDANKVVEAVATDERINQQIAQNRADLTASAQVGVRVLEMLEIAQNPKELKALSGALKDCQAVARLALGMTTENNGHSGLDGKDIGIISKILIVGGKSVDSTDSQE